MNATETSLDKVILNAQEQGKIPRGGVVLNLGDGMHTRKAFEKRGYKFHDYEAQGMRPDQIMPKEADILFIDPIPGLMPDAFKVFREQANRDAVLLAIGSEENWQFQGDPGVTHAGTVRVPENGTYTVYKK